jgi:uncharacterized protein YigA (DUF484 family)
VGQVIQFEERAMARLRERLGAMEEANEDLIAFARGHSGAVSLIHSAVLAAVESPSLEALLRTISRDWPIILGIDSAAVALQIGGRAYHASCDGIGSVEPVWIERMLAGRPAVEVRAVERGHALFGADGSAKIRAEALIRIDSAGRSIGLVALGQQVPLEVHAGHGSELLLFLGRILASTARRLPAER